MHGQSYAALRSATQPCALSSVTGLSPEKERRKRRCK
ncbi:hypothetical protein IL54_0172 [Sphingobium sp. ba1]|nr:hypothetical protein IL54_0172 [Sphingobium sp. ba1]